MSPRALVPALALAIGCSSQPEPAEPARPSFLVVVIESLDAATIAALRQDPDPAPTIARLAREGAFFEQAYAQAGWTLPGLASLLTGRYPFLGDKGSAAAALKAVGSPTLPEVLGHYDYSTAAFWGATLACTFGSELPFQHRSPERCGSSRLPYDSAMGDWIDAGVQAPFFALMHNIDLHTPEPSAPAETLHRFTNPHPACPGEGTGFVYEQLEPEMGAQAAAQHVVGHYRGQLAFYDQALKRMLERLEDAGLMEQTVVVITTNHGQDLFQHICFDHGALYDSVLHIPLIWWEPGLQAREIRSVVQTIDIAPSILDRAEIPHSSLDGQSLLPLLGSDEGAYEPRPVLSLSKGRSASMRTPERKLIASQGLRLEGCAAVRTPPPKHSDGVHYELYDLQADPGETVDLFEQQREEAQDMLRALESWLEGRRPAADDAPPPISERERRTLQERGYWDLGSPDEEG